MHFSPQTPQITHAHAETYLLWLCHGNHRGRLRHGNKLRNHGNSLLLLLLLRFAGADDGLCGCRLLGGQNLENSVTLSDSQQQ